MQEHLRAHNRLKDTPAQGTIHVLNDILPQSVTLYIPSHFTKMDTLNLLVHFNGAAHVPIHAVDQLKESVVLAVVHLGSGSSVYERPFLHPAIFNRFVQEVSGLLDVDAFQNIYLSAFSAGYGAIRALLKTHFKQIDGILLLDALHTDYMPKGVPLAQGSKLNTEKLQGFLDYAQAATDSDKKMIITHSEIFPGTFASLTETTDWLLAQLQLERTPILQWGPVGMQQLGEAEKGHFHVLSFAGNTAPDHVDHFHGMPFFLKMLLDEKM
ncbi:MAG: hypothetical protein AAGA86_02985 [Bacteroidota bacterium]